MPTPEYARDKGEIRSVKTKDISSNAAIKYNHSNYVGADYEGAYSILVY